MVFFISHTKYRGFIQTRFITLFVHLSIFLVSVIDKLIYRETLHSAVYNVKMSMNEDILTSEVFQGRQLVMLDTVILFGFDSQFYISQIFAIFEVVT